MKTVKNYLYNVVYQLFVIIVPLITVPYISRVLGKTAVGINAYTNSIVTYFVLFGSIGVALYGNRTVAYRRNDPKELTKVFWEITLMRLITISIAILAYALYVFFIAREYHSVLLAQGLLLLAAAFDISWLFMGLEDFKKTVVRNMIVKVASLVLIFTFVKTRQDLILFVIITAGSQFFGTLTFWPYLRKTLVKTKVSELDLWQHFMPSIALFIPEIATQVYLVLNKTMLGKWYSVDSAGYFDNSDKIVRVLLAVVTATGTVMLPRVASTFAAGNFEKVKSYLNVTFDFVSIIAFPLAFGIIAVADNFSLVYFGPGFAGIEDILKVLPLVIIFISWSNAIGKQFLLPTNQMKPYTASVIGGAFVNIILNIMVIIPFGAVGAAIASVIAEGVVTGIQLFAVRQTLQLKYLFKNTWKYLLAAGAMGMVAYMIGTLRAGVTGLVLQVVIGAMVYVLLILLLKPTILKIVLQFIKTRRISEDGL